jgi:tRNA(adenine34) deaminase
MQMALQLAAEAAASGEVPVGAVVVQGGTVIGSGRNSPIHSSDPSAHAEMVALRAAAKAMGNYRLDDCTLYVSLEPCAMCSGAMLHSRLRRVVFGAPDPKTGCAGSVLNLFGHPQLNHQTQVDGGLLQDQSRLLMQTFFQHRREQQREMAVPLREDALRTSDRYFKNLQGVHWAAHYVSDLPALAGLRMHWVDEGAPNTENVYVCLHPIPGWSYCYHHAMADWLGQGRRVLVPDLIGFGRSDKPKREDAHTLEFHTQYLCEWLERLHLRHVTWVVAQADHPLLHRLITHACACHHDVLVHPEIALVANETDDSAVNAPYPDPGHRAGERAFASKRMQCLPEEP